MCEQSDYTITVPLSVERTDLIGFDTNSTITVTFEASSGNYIVTNGITCTPDPDPLPSGQTTPTISQSTHQITFYEQTGTADADFIVEVATDTTTEARAGGPLETPTSRITFRPRPTCPS